MSLINREFLKTPLTQRLLVIGDFQCNNNSLRITFIETDVLGE